MGNPWEIKVLRQYFQWGQRTDSGRELQQLLSLKISSSLNTRGLTAMSSEYD